VVSAAFVFANGADLDALWKQQPLQHYLRVLGAIAFMASLWFAPVYAWLLFVSAAVKRGVFLWAVMPSVALIAIEKIVFKSTVFAEIILSRFIRFNETNSTVGQIDQAANLATKVESGRPHFAIDFDLKFFTSSEVWIGLAIAAVLLIATTHIRRLRDPI
jgi:ABC-2 type transport system permease protein